jgi:hypothetical protein
MDIQDNIRILSQTIGNLATGGSIGTAATTVDVCGGFNINQTTSGQTITLPNPTNSGAGLRVDINNIGAVSFTMLGTVVLIGSYLSAQWNGATWTKSTPPVAVSVATPPKVTTFLSSGTFTKDPLSTYAIVEMVGGGGQGGYGFGSAGANTAYVGMGGGSGGYAKVLLTAAQIGASQFVTVGSPGGSSLFGSLATAGGGQAGTGMYVNSDAVLTSGTATFTNPRATFSITTGTDLGSKFGNLPSDAFVSQGSGRCCVQTSDGADSEMGRGARGLKPPNGPQQLTTPGAFAAQAAGANTGGGGSGDSTYSPTAATGTAGSVAAGGSGKVIVTEFFN